MKHPRTAGRAGPPIRAGPAAPALAPRAFRKKSVLAWPRPKFFKPQTVCFAAKFEYLAKFPLGQWAAGQSGRPGELQPIVGNRIFFTVPRTPQPAAPETAWPFGFEGGAVQAVPGGPPTPGPMQLVGPVNFLRSKQGVFPFCPTAQPGPEAAKRHGGVRGPLGKFKLRSRAGAGRGQELFQGFTRLCPPAAWAPARNGPVPLPSNKQNNRPPCPAQRNLGPGPPETTGHRDSTVSRCSKSRGPLVPQNSARGR